MVTTQLCMGHQAKPQSDPTTLHRDEVAPMVTMEDDAELAALLLFQG
jgi:hypothetical protein